MRQRYLMLCLLCLMAFSRVAVGQESDPSKLFERGETYYNVGEWEQALANYKEAYILSKEPALLFNMAQCYRQLNRYDDAIRTYKNYLKEVPDTEIRAIVEGFIQDMESRRAASSAPALAVTLPASAPTSIANTPTSTTPTPTSAALTPAPITQEPAPNKKLILFAGIGGGVIVTGALLGLSLWRTAEVKDSTLGTFTPFP